MWRRCCLFLLLFSYFGFLPQGFSQEQVCFDFEAATADESCTNYAKTLVDKPEKLLSLARQLEIGGRFAAALQIYRIGLKFQSKNRALQQGFIRTRSEVKAQQLLTGLRPKAKTQEVSRCWDTHWTDALEACQQELKTRPKDPMLYERLGDVLRSVGRPKAALRAYQASLALSHSTQVSRKHQTLTELVELEAGTSPVYIPVAASANPKKANQPTTSTAKPTQRIDGLASNSVNRLELLADLKARGLVTEQEYRSRRIAILDSSLGNPPPRRPAEGALKPALNPSGRYRALIIGNEKYKHFPTLESPASDASAISEILSSSYGFDVTTALNVSRYESFQALAKLRRETRDDDNVLVYFAGHGYLDEVTSRGYWLPVDAEKDNSANWISTGDIVDLLAGIPAHHVLVIADSCFSGSLIRSASGVTIDKRNDLLKRLYEKRSRTILTSGGLEPVLDSGSQRHSVFAFALLKALAENQGVLEAGRLFVDVRDRVSAVADQTPQYGPLRSAGHDGGDFIFIRTNTASSDI